MSTQNKTYLVVNRKDSIELRRLYKPEDEVETDGVDNHRIIGGTTITIRNNKAEVVGRTKTDAVVSEAEAADEPAEKVAE
jgi:hypothetical protein